MSKKIYIYSLLLVFGACAAKPPKANLPPEIKELELINKTEPVVLLLKATEGTHETVKYFNRSLTKTYDHGEVLHEKEETMLFSARAKTLAVTADDFTQSIETLSKDGQGDLRFFALPEVGERLDITSKPDGTVVKAGDYSRNSIFYVPPISLPKEAVRVGDTWTMQARWVTLADGRTPYMSDMVSILKSFRKCGANECAEIEVSGEVFMPEQIQKQLGFKSTWHGFLIFDINQGTVLWSRTESDERYATENAARLVNSCLEALLIEPEANRLQSKQKIECEQI